MSSKKKKAKSKNKNEYHGCKYAIGDVVLCPSNGKSKELARIRWIGKTKLSKKNLFYGVEYFKYKIGTHNVCKRKVIDGKIAKDDPLFKTNKKGYGTFISSSTLDKSGQLKWSKKISDQYMKSEQFEKDKFSDACKYGSNKVVKHLLKQPGYELDQTRSGFRFAVTFNHSSIVQTIFEHHYGVKSNDIDDEKINDNDNDKWTFFHKDSLAKLIKSRNRKILELVLKFDKWPIIREGYVSSNKLIHKLFSTKGNLNYIKYLIEKLLQYKGPLTLSDHLNFPLLQSEKNFDSTIMHTIMRYNRWDYLQYLLIESPCKQYIKVEYQSRGSKHMPPSPLLLCLILSVRGYDEIGILEKYAPIMLKMGANINWVSPLTLKRQLFFLQLSRKILHDEGLGGQENVKIIMDSHLYHYDLEDSNQHYAEGNARSVVIGSILSAFIYHILENWQGMFTKLKIDSAGPIGKIIKLFLQYGANLDYNDTDLKVIEWTKWNKFKEEYPKNIYIAGNSYVEGISYLSLMPQPIKCQKMKNETENLLKDIFTLAINEYKLWFLSFLESVNMDDGIRFVMVEFLPNYLCWDLEFVDKIQVHLPPQKPAPPRTNNYYDDSSSMNYSMDSW